jgi:hypothetical protein
VIVDGQTLVAGGKAVRIDEEAVYAQARQATQQYWQRLPSWHWGGCDIAQIIPPAFPMHRQAVTALRRED